MYMNNDSKSEMLKKLKIYSTTNDPRRLESLYYNEILNFRPRMGLVDNMVLQKGGHDVLTYGSDELNKQMARDFPGNSFWELSGDEQLKEMGVLPDANQTDILNSLKDVLNKRQAKRNALLNNLMTVFTPKSGLPKVINFDFLTDFYILFYNGSYYNRLSDQTVVMTKDVCSIMRNYIKISDKQLLTDMNWIYLPKYANIFQAYNLKPDYAKDGKTPILSLKDRDEILHNDELKDAIRRQYYGTALRSDPLNIGFTEDDRLKSINLTTPKIIGKGFVGTALLFQTRNNTYKIIVKEILSTTAPAAQKYVGLEVLIWKAGPVDQTSFVKNYGELPQFSGHINMTSLIDDKFRGYDKGLYINYNGYGVKNSDDIVTFSVSLENFSNQTVQSMVLNHVLTKHNIENFVYQYDAFYCQDRTSRYGQLKKTSFTALTKIAGYSFTEFADKGELYHVINNEEEALRSRRKSQGRSDSLMNREDSTYLSGLFVDIFRQILKPLRLLQHPKYAFVHGDLKVKNILVKTDPTTNSNIYLLSDFDKSSITWNSIRFYNEGSLAVKSAYATQKLSNLLDYSILPLTNKHGEDHIKYLIKKYNQTQEVQEYVSFFLDPSVTKYYFTESGIHDINTISEELESRISENGTKLRELESKLTELRTNQVQVRDKILAETKRIDKMDFDTLITNLDKADQDNVVDAKLIIFDIIIEVFKEVYQDGANISTNKPEEDITNVKIKEIPTNDIINKYPDFLYNVGAQNVDVFIGNFGFINSALEGDLIDVEKLATVKEQFLNSDLSTQILLKFKPSRLGTNNKKLNRWYLIYKLGELNSAKNDFEKLIVETEKQMSSLNSKIIQSQEEIKTLTSNMEVSLIYVKTNKDVIRKKINDNFGNTQKFEEWVNRSIGEIRKEIIEISRDFYQISGSVHTLALSLSSINYRATKTIEQIETEMLGIRYSPVPFYSSIDIYTFVFSLLYMPLFYDLIMYLNAQEKLGEDEELILETIKYLFYDEYYFSGIMTDYKRRHSEPDYLIDVQTSLAKIYNYAKSSSLPLRKNIDTLFKYYETPVIPEEDIKTEFDNLKPSSVVISKGEHKLCLTDCMKYVRQTGSTQSKQYQPEGALVDDAYIIKFPSLTSFTSPQGPAYLENVCKTNRYSKHVPFTTLFDWDRCN